MTRLVALTLATVAYGISAVATAAPFTYQGQLKHEGIPVTGTVALEFRVWTSATGGSLLDFDGPVVLDLVNGLFTTQVEFGDGVFSGGARWLELRAQMPSGTWTTLSPRQTITATPYALMAQKAQDLELPFAATVDSGANAITVTQTGVGRAASFQTNGSGNDEAVLYVSHGGQGPCGHFAVNNASNSQPAVVAQTTGTGPGVHAKGFRSGAAVKGSALGSGRAAYFHTEYASNDSPTLYVEQEGMGRCGHFRITNASNDLAGVAASTTGDGVAVSGYTIGEGSAGKFEINNAGSDAVAVVAKSNGSGYAVSAQSASDASASGGGVVVIGSTTGRNVAIDGNEIMARDDGETSTLHINHDGGDVRFGGAIDIGYQIIDAYGSGETAEAHCPVGKKVLSGGCSCGLDDVEGSYAVDDGDGWRCRCSGDGTSAHAICARVK